MPELTRYARRLPALFFDGIVWALLFSGLWALLTKGQGLMFGTASVLAATTAALSLHLQPRRLHVQHLPAALLLFFRELLAGAFNVAHRTVKRNCQLRPAWVRYRLQSADPSIQLLVASIVGLLPGTVASRIDNGIMTLHLLDETMDWEATIAAVERRVIKLFGARTMP